MRKIAILGSSATRHNFNTIFNPNYKKKFECVLMQNQSSIISMASAKRPNPVIKEDDFNKYDEESVSTDFTKTFFDDLSKIQPDTIIIDLFADAHFGVIEVEPGEYITDNRWKLWRTTYYKNELKDKAPKLTLDTDKDHYLEVFKKSWDIVLKKIKEVAPKSKIVLHEIQNVKEYYNFDDKKYNLINSGKVMKIDTDMYNQALQEMHRYIEQSDKAIQVINLFDGRELYLSFDEHPWGLFYVHYTMDYYVSFLEQLIAIEKKESFFDHLKRKSYRKSK
ncbi:DUF6270 domain-containing protein [Listeria booriae]|uniref:DUF6270 domain-containing protein n=1 Tax=Listeria booriae TaxID=1552123 RepID=UPI001623FDCD|nr:DUF6270 domain-containing protein [Listeria booriae]MBC2147106.1 hypothetical protein [Listeria booriae]